MKPHRVHIDLGERSYDIAIGAGLLDDVTAHLPFDVSGKKLFLITDTNVEPYAAALQKSLLVKGAGLCEVLVHPFGESTKSYERLQRTHDWLLENNIHRNSVVFAIGGGVIGDLGGFAASTILRGVPYVQIPTSLLAQVDSSVGGKTGINTQYGKNLVGNFYQPVSVIADIDTLKTLPKRELLAGYAEVVKYGLLGDLAFFEWLEKNEQDVIDLKPEAVTYAIEMSCRKKAEIVEADEKEGGVRALLNLGHTFGHALEAAAGYDGTLLHGEGVAIGTMMAFDLSVRMGLCTQSDVDRVQRHFEAVKLPVAISDVKTNGAIQTTTDNLIATMRRDKKAMDNTMVFIVAKGIGQTFVSKDVPENLVRDVLNSFLNEGH
tara:strand:- start:10179 stop:11306 length:1128 start_codon:yes stop_codon:yes gene_type:complete